MVDARKWLRGDIGDEFEEAKLGDARRTSRLQDIARAAEVSPDAGFPQMAESDGELEGIYRFFGNDAVSANAILEPHIAATMERAKGAEVCLIVHDTTAFEFSGSRKGLGLTTSQRLARRILRRVVRMAFAQRIFAHRPADTLQPTNAEWNPLLSWQDSHREVRIETRTLAIPRAGE